MITSQPAHKKKAFTLIEVLVFTSILVIALTTMIGTSIYAALNINSSRFRTIASHYNSELAEWIRFQRDKCGYKFIKQKHSSPTGVTYCFNSTDLGSGDQCPGSANAWPSQGACTDFSLNSAFKREALITDNTSLNRLEVTITTFWYLFSNQQSTITQFYLSQFQ